MRLHWATPIYRPIGNSFGWALTQRAFRDCMTRQGVRFDEKAPIALHMVEPSQFRAVPGKLNVLYSMYENPRLEPERAKAIRDANVVITPTRWCRDIFRPYRTGPIYVVPLGVDTRQFVYRERKAGRPFLFLWCGAPNARKGWDVIEHVYRHYYYRHPMVRFYLKTTGTGRNAVDSFDNVTVDSRTMSVGSLVQLYHRAHAFLLPTAAEGFGLTLAEAMATGLPSVVTDYSGVTDLADPETAWMVGYTMRERPNSEGNTHRIPFANPSDVARAMADIMGNYPKAVRCGKRAAHRMRQFSWDRSTKSLVRTLAQLQ